MGRAGCECNSRTLLSRCSGQSQSMGRFYLRGQQCCLPPRCPGRSWWNSRNWLLRRCAHRLRVCRSRLEGQIRALVPGMWYLSRHTPSFLLAADALVHGLHHIAHQPRVLEIELEHQAEDLLSLWHDVLFCHGHQYLPIASSRYFPPLVPSRDVSKNPLVQIIFALHSQRHLDAIPLDGLVSTVVPTAQPTRFDLECHFFQEDDYLHSSFLFADDLFEIGRAHV